MPDVEQVEVAVGERHATTGAAQLREARRERGGGQDLAHRTSSTGRGSDRIAAVSSSRPRVAVPIFITTTPPA